MKIIFVGYAISKKECDKQVGASIAGNNMQVGIIKELFKLNNNNLDIISLYPTISYPRSKKVIFKKKLINIDNDINSISIPFLNIPIIKQISQIINLYLELIRYAKKNKNIKIVTFNAYPLTGLPIRWISRFIKCETICILADLPLDIEETKGIKRVLTELYKKETVKSIKCYNKIIALNKEAINIYAKNTENIIIDGGFDKELFRLDSETKSYKHKEEKIIVFSGALIEYNGIINLVEAMRYIKSKEIKLHIYGEGPLENYIKNECVKNEKIVFKGKVTNVEMLDIQKNAYMLINPREVNNLISKVTFPSKIIEYLLSGTPTMSTKLNGLTNDYLKYLNIIDDTNKNTMAKDIEAYCTTSYDSLMQKAECGKKYIFENKSWDKQGEKIYNFIIDNNN